MHSVIRCPWATHPLEIEYHDTEWGVPAYEDLYLFEKLTLDGAQAGLSWLTILKKREGYRQAFDGFDPHKIAYYDESKKQTLMQDKGIVRNRLKIESTINNAQVFIKLCERYNSFSQFVWQFTNGKPIINHYKTIADVPAYTPFSDKVSKHFKKEGFRFVGSTIIYAFLQAIGVINDHLTDCFRYKQVQT